MITNILKERPKTLIEDLILREFSKPPFENSIYEYERILKEHSTIIDFKNIYNYNPQRVSYDYYKTKNLYPIILLANDIPSIIQFNSDNLNKIIVPDYDIIVQIANNLV